jgi:iron complex transport system ATP-binding protein
MVKVEQISVRKGGKLLLNKISLEVYPGTFTAIVGANGAGKSTLLGAMSGKEKLAAGRVTIKGRQLEAYTTRQLAKMRGILSQHLHLPFSMKVIDVVLLGRHIHTETEGQKESEKVAQYCLREVGLAGYEHRDIHTLSGGEKQRAHLARVLAQILHNGSLHHQYMFLDEPTSSQDMAQQLLLLNLLKKLVVEKGMSVVAVLHELNHAARYADQMLLLKSGQVLAYGTPKEVITQQNIQAAYGIQAEIHHHLPGAAIQVFPFLQTN